MKKIYLAGPDVFFQDANAHFEALETACLERGMQGMRPSDGGLSKGITGTRHQIAHRIYQANMELIHECDGIIANLMPFRGQIEPDSGTCFEIGAAIALGKPVGGYLTDGLDHYADKVARHFGSLPRDAMGLVFDKEFGMMIEEFDLPVNLMIACSSSLHVSMESALDQMKVDLAANPRNKLKWP